MNAAGCVLALTFVDQCGGLPVPHRAVWVAWLRHFEPRPADVHEAAQMLHFSGHLHRDRLTPEGVRAALEVMHEALTPPGPIGGDV